MAEIRGLEKLRRNLRALDRSTGGADIDRICFESLKPLKEATEFRAPRISLKRGVAIVKRKNKGQRGREFWVSFRRGMAMRIAHLVELGTAPHSMAKGASRRRGLLQDVPPFSPGTPPEPFFRPAFEQTKGEVVNTFGKLMWGLIKDTVRGRA